MIYDLIVVGSGSVGAATGFYATQSGLSVLMIDSAHPPHSQGAHHGETRLIRHAYGEGKRYIPLILRAQTLWDELERQSGERIMHRSGILNLAPFTSPFIQNVIDSANALQLDVALLQADEVRKRWPQITVPDGYLGVFEPHSGFLKCQQAVRSWVQLAKQAGCAQLFNCAVTKMGHDGDVQLVTTSDGVFRARKLLISAGTWVRQLVNDLPIAPVRKVFAWYQADGRYSENNHFPGFIVEMPDGSHFYGFPADNNALKVGRHDGGQLMDKPADRKPFGSFAADGSEAFGFLRQFLPGVGVCLHGEACSYDNTPDGDFIIDTLPGEPHRLIITGLSGHGFKFASVLGELASEFAQNKPFSFDLTPFSLARFA